MRTVFPGRRRAVRGRRQRDQDWTRGGEHVDASASGAELGEGGEVAENRGSGEAEADGLGFGLPPSGTPTRSIRCDCPGRAAAWSVAGYGESGNIRLGSARRTSGGFAGFVCVEDAGKPRAFQVRKPVSGQTCPCKPMKEEIYRSRFMLGFAQRARLRPSGFPLSRE